LAIKGERVPNEPLDQYKEYLEAVAERSLSRYLERLERPDGHRIASKEFNDPVWGTLVLTPLEIIVLDSPLIQRLRHIRQLGVAHLVYPGAGHSRLEHSIGVTHQLQGLIDATNSSSIGAHRHGPVIDDRWTRLLRLAALVHDCGHGVMSHVSENALVYSDEVEQLRLAFEDTVARRALGEINSYLLIGSPAFSALLDQATRLAEAQLPNDAQSLLQSIIVGQRVRKDIPFLQELISGPFDADKLDYMTRDARMAGVPEATDVNRLLRKIRAVDVPPRQLPPPYLESVEERDTVTVVAVARSGNRTLDELTLARTLMFDKIYRHQKVRAAESMVAAIFEQFARIAPSGQGAARLAMVLTDDELMRPNWEEPIILEHIDKSHPAFQNAKKVVDDLASRLRERRLYRRAVAFATKMPSDPYSGFEPHKLGISRFLLEMDSSPEGRRRFAESISEDVLEAIRHVGDEHLLEEFPDGSIYPYIWIDAPRAMTNPTETTNALLVTDDGKLIPFSAEAPETPNWALAYTQTRDVGYVFSEERLASYVALVVERRLRTEYDIRLPRWMLAPGVPRDRLEDLRSRLDRAGFYEGSPWTLRPTPAPLALAGFGQRREKLAGLLRAYHGPTQRREELGKQPIHPLRVERFVSQFRDDEMIDAALRMLGELRMVGRHDLATGVRSFVAENEAFVDAHVVPLGEFRDSAGQAAYFALDAQDDIPGLRAVDLEVAIGSEKPIIFVDDYVGSGAQASSIVKAWFGDMTGADALSERQRRVLPDRIQAELRDHPIGFVFAAGMEGGVTALGEAARDVGLEVADVYAAVRDRDIPRAFRDVSYADDAQAAGFQDYCSRVGLSLMANSVAREERKLGYGNNALLLVFPYNTPTHTLTLLWASGEFGGASWEPLLPRRKKS
jgi:deoxynucleoside triphosphate triphosphohydrolase SAMHD1